jgi:hypothetical protein
LKRFFKKREKNLLTRVKLVTVYELFATKAGGDLAAYFRPANATI